MKPLYYVEEQYYPQNNQNQYMSNNINTSLYYQVPYSNYILGQTVNNTVLLQENINPNNLTELKESNSATKLEKVNNDNLYKSSNDIMDTIPRINAKKNLSKSVQDSSFQDRKKRLESSGILVKSKRAPKYNKVLKDGKKIKNIDINDDCEDTMKDEDSISSLPMKAKKKSNDSSIISNSKKNSNVQPKQTIKIKQNDINSENTPNKNLKINPKSKFQPEHTIRRTKSNIENLKLKNHNFDKISKNNETNDIKSKISSGSSQSKPPFQDFAGKENPMIPNGQNLFGSPIYNINTHNTNNTNNTNNTLNTQKTDNYLSIHLGEYLEKEMNSINPAAMPSPTITNKKIGKGFKFCSDFTKAGKDPDGNTKIDQDTPLVSLNIGGIQGFNLFGVLDGHGMHGHFVSQFCKEYFIKNMTNYAEILKSTRGIMTSEGIYNELKSKGFSYIIDLYNLADSELTKQDTFDYNLSGTTCNIVFQFEKHLVCANTGDSRSILVYDTGDLKNQGIFPLSYDHKPNLPTEYQRIQENGGMVDQIIDMFGNKIGPPRVFKVGTRFPGLAMSRSIGDLFAKECGVIPTPQIIEYEINSNTKYMVICSDGVWEFIQNEQVRDLGNVFYAQNNVKGFCFQLVNYAFNMWEQLEDIRDDITVVSVFF
jgi:serine/threonine protein phosphatase PrpC